MSVEPGHTALAVMPVAPSSHQTGHAVLGRRVGGEERESLVRSRGGDGDEPTATGFRGRQHGGDRGTREVEHTGEVDLDHRAPDGVVGLPGGDTAGHGTGRGDDDIDVPVVLDRTGDDGGKSIGIPDVGEMRVAPTLARGRGALELVGRGAAVRAGHLDVGMIDERHGIAATRQSGGGERTHSSCRAGDDRDWRAFTHRLCSC